MKCGSQAKWQKEDGNYEHNEKQEGNDVTVKSTKQKRFFYSITQVEYVIKHNTFTHGIIHSSTKTHKFIILKL